MPSGTVKFFNPSKGFGFITPEDGSADIFVHISAVERSGLRSLNDGDQVRFQVEEDRRSGKVNATDLEVTGSGPAPSRAGERPQGGAPRGGYDPRDSYDPRGSFDRRNQSDRRESFGGTSVIAGRGTVKWFNTQKGFGFIAPEAGGDDVFVHISAVERAGLRDLHEGQVLTFDVEQSRNGKPAAVNLRQVG